MFDTLLESNSKSQPAGGGALASVVTHAAVIAAALVGTAQARVAPLHTVDVVSPIYFPTRPPVLASAPSPSRADAVIRGQLPIVVPKMPTIDFKTASLADLASPPIEFPAGRADATPGDATGTTSGSGSSTAFQAEEVDRQAALIGGTVGLTYPEPLRRSGIGGEVVALFVVGPDGRADADSVRFLRSDNALFDEAVRQALRRMRFRAAEIAGRKVSQLVQMPFVFTIER